MIAEVRDRGTLRDPLVGRLNPDAFRFDGLGLWLVNQLSDPVQFAAAKPG